MICEKEVLAEPDASDVAFLLVFVEHSNMGFAGKRILNDLLQGGNIGIDISRYPCGKRSNSCLINLFFRHKGMPYAVRSIKHGHSIYKLFVVRDNQTRPVQR